MIPTILDVAALFDGFAFTYEQAITTARMVIDAQSKGSKVTLNFYGVKFFTTLYFAELFKLLPNVDDVNFLCLSYEGHAAYNTALQNKNRLDAMTDTQRARRNEILAELLEE